MKFKNIDIIVYNIITMIDTNYPYKTDCIGEKFIDWCENGNIFANNEFLTKEDIKECEEIMQQISPFVDMLTAKLYEIYNKGE